MSIYKKNFGVPWQMIAQDDYFRELEGLPTLKQCKRMRRKRFFRLLNRFIPALLMVICLTTDRHAGTWICDENYYTTRHENFSSFDAKRYELLTGCRCIRLE